MEKQIAIEITRLTVKMHMVKTGLVGCNVNELKRLVQFELDEWITANRFCREHRLGMTIETSELAELYLRIKSEHFYTIDDAVNLARSSSNFVLDTSIGHAVLLDCNGRASLVHLNPEGAVVNHPLTAPSFSKLVTDFEGSANQLFCNS